MRLEDFFFNVDISTLTAYIQHVTDYNFFVDDLQSLWFFDTDPFNFDHVVVFLEQVHAGMRGDLVLWVFVDVGQSRNVRVNNNYVTSLFYLNKSTPRSLNIPVYTLTKILRNTVEISNATQRVRRDRVKRGREERRVSTKNTTGHRIRSVGVAYHRLTACTGGRGNWEKWARLFVVERLKDAEHRV